tara:strand:+ start:1039 stop:3153 length:2115 start_codon:yes stop_codon:yes gene_type:complete
MKISEIISSIDNNQLFVPVFQREYVWKRENVKSLFDSLIKGYPFGTMLTWSTNNPPKMKGNILYDNKMGAIKLILDGQQRITSLYLNITGKIPPYYEDKEITVDTRGLYVNLESGDLQYYKKTIMEKDPLWVNLTDVFADNNKILMNILEKDDYKNRSDKILSTHGKIKSILQRDFIEQVIPIEAKIREAIDIFYTVNSGGITLTDAELALAQISGYWEEARDLFKKKIFELSDKGFEFRLDFIVYSLLAVMYQSGDEMKKLHSPENKEKIIKTWEILDKYVLDYVINILKNKAFVDHTEEINSYYALIPIIVYYFKKFESGEKHFSDEETNKIIRWFYYSQIRNRYISQLPQKLSKDSKIAWESENPFDELLLLIEEERSLKITENEFEGRNVSHPLFKLCIFYFKSKNAVCLTTNVPIHQTMGKMYQLERDHIFPYSVLKKLGYGMGEQNYRLAQEFTNRALLTKIANRDKSAKSAENYLNTIDNKSLLLQSIPTDPNLWKIENFQDFLVERRKVLAKQLNKFLDGFSKTEKTTSTISIETLIDKGESDQLEFKSTFRWSLDKHQTDKVLEGAILKTISAFTNSDGGTLLIGVANNGDIIGLEHDYKSFGKSQDKDAFELTLRNSISNAFDMTFTSRLIKIEFYEINDKEICKVEIKKSNQLVFIDLLDKSGKKIKQAFIRSGNASKALDPEEIVKYTKENF